MPNPIDRLTAARFDGEQALYTTAVRLLGDQPALPDDLVGLVARLRYEQSGAEFSNKYADLIGEAADAIDALAAQVEAMGWMMAARDPQWMEIDVLKGGAA